MKKFLVPSILGTRKTRERIIAYIEENGQASGVELADFLGITDCAVRKQLSALSGAGVLIKRGKAPRVFYMLHTEKKRSDDTLDVDAKNTIEKNFLYVSPRGECVHGFALWCERRGFDPQARSVEYVQIYKKYEALKKNGNITLDGYSRICQTGTRIAQMRFQSDPFGEQ